MNRFIDLAGTYVNADAIKEYEIDINGSAIVDFTDGSREVYPFANARYATPALDGRYHVLQVIPAAFAAYNVYASDGETPTDFIEPYVLGIVRGRRASGVVTL